MHPLSKYIVGEAETVSIQELDGLIGRYGWFTTARRARALLTGTDDPCLILPLSVSPTVSPAMHECAVAAAGKMAAGISTEDTIIERFLEHGGYRITPGETGLQDEFAANEPEDAFGDGEMLTEELAEIYRSQGLDAEAREIYRRLSLLNPEKSIYFADIIARMDNDNNKQLK